MVKIVPLVFLSVSLIQAQDGLMKAVLSRYQAVERDLLETAAAMPADGFQYRFNPKQRSSGDWVALTIMRMQGACAGIQGVRIPPGPPDVNGGQPKNELIKKLQVVASSCEQTLNDLSDKDALTDNQVVGPPINVMLALLTDISNSTGNMNTSGQKGSRPSP
jgi:hypothetical protein